MPNIREVKAQKLEEKKKAHDLEKTVADLKQALEQLKSEVAELRVLVQPEDVEEVVEVKPTKSTTSKK